MNSNISKQDFVKAELAKSILDKIKSKHIRPIPRWWVLTKRALFWLFLGIFSSLGIVAVALFLSDFNLSNLTNLANPNLGFRGRIFFIFSSLPIIWIGGIILFGALAFWNFKSTSKGYRHPSIKIFLASLLISIIGGGLLELSGATNRMELRWGEKLETIRSFQARMQSLWMNPDAGYLMGRILNDLGESPEKLDLLTLEDPTGKIWIISPKGAEWRGIHRIREDHRVRIMGQKTSETEFRATQLLPWPGRGHGKGPGMGMGRGPGRGMGRGMGHGTLSP